MSYELLLALLADSGGESSEDAPCAVLLCVMTAKSLGRDGKQEYADESMISILL